MAGIAGIIELNLEMKNLTDALIKMSGQMSKRGPDGEAYLFADVATKRNTIYSSVPEKGSFSEVKIVPQPFSLGLVQRHLKSSGSETATVPISNRKEDLYIVMDGHLYNREEVKIELERYGHRDSLDTDAELFMKAYQEWGMDCLSHFNGDFSIVLYDVERARVYFIRDRIGVKQLYYTIENNRLIFASDVKTLIASGLYQPEVNPEGLWHALSHYIAPRPMTCFEGVFSFESGCYMLIELGSGRKEVVRYWEVPVGQEDLDISEKEHLEILEQKIWKSLEYRMPKDSKIGSFLSGGVDSGLISSMGKMIDPDILALTVGFDEKYTSYDEVREAINTARMNEIRHKTLFMDADYAQNIVRDVVLCAEEPYCIIDPAFPTLEEAQKNGIQIMINGLGADEIFGGYGWHFDPKDIPYPYRDIGQEGVASRYAKIHSQISEMHKEMILPQYKGEFDTTKVLGKLYGKPRECFKNVMDEINYYDLKAYVGNHHMYRNDGFLSAFSIEGRFPYLDHEIVSFAFRIPVEMKIRYNHVKKYILKALAVKYIPLSAIVMPKKGFSSPTVIWFENELKEFAQKKIDRLLERNLFARSKESIEFIRRKSVRMALLEMWMEEFID